MRINQVTARKISRIGTCRDNRLPFSRLKRKDGDAGLAETEPPADVEQYKLTARQNFWETMLDLPLALIWMRYVLARSSRCRYPGDYDSLAREKVRSVGGPARPTPRGGA